MLKALGLGRGITIKMKTLKCKPSAYFAYSYSINVLSKYSSLISHRLSMFEGLTHRPSIFEDRHINHRSSKVDTSIIDLRRSTHRSPKVDTSIFEGRHIVTSIFEGRRIDLRRSKAETSHLQFVTEYCPQLRS